MQIMYIIGYTSSIVWLFPIFRQFKTNFFYFFLILGLMDPLNIIFVSVFGLTEPGILFTVASLLLFFSIDYSLQVFLNNWKKNLTIVLVCVILMIYLTNLEILVSVIHLFILFKFIKKTVIKLHSEGEFNFFYLVLIFYELSLIFNLIVRLSASETVMAVFISTLTFQMLVAVFFTIFRENSPLLTIRTKISDL